MVFHKNQAWVTAVINDADGKKAVGLAGSLRRVLTTKKLVVVFSSNVCEEVRDLLRDKFDLAVLIDQNIPDGVDAEDFAKIFAFSFNVFNKCVYLSTSTMVLQHCDEMFETDASFAAFVNTEKEIDTSVFLLTPSFRHYKAMRKIVGNKELWKNMNGTGFSNYFGKWLLNQETASGTFHQKYNQKISLMSEMEIYDGLLADLGIVNFVDVHPCEVGDQILSSKMSSLGIVESLVVDQWLTIYMEEMRTRNAIQDDESLSSLLDGKIENEPIAIVGMSCRYPGANNVDDFWKLLSEGRDGVRSIPLNRWKRDTSVVTKVDESVNAGFLTVPVDEFDAKFFGISPKDAVFLDPQQRLLHEVTWEAFEDAAIDPLHIRGTNTGVFVGSWIFDYKEIVCRMPDVDFFRVYMGTSIASGAARLSYFLGTTGPSVPTESGCSSAIVAVDMACKTLQNHDTNLAIACGVNLLLHPFNNDTLSFVVSPDGRCKTFDAKANGFGRAEGCGVLLLKRYSDAVKDGDKIWGLIRGSAITQEGLSKSLGTPTTHCEALAMELALKDAGVHPRDVSFVEAHGTGTPVGDPMEVLAIAKTYSKGRTTPLLIGSVKTNIGHTESVSGITGIMKVILSLKNELIPRHLNFDSLNPNINLDAIPAQIPLTEIAWPRNKDKPRIAGVSSFGISGTDGHVIVQEAPQENTQQMSINMNLTRPLDIMKISAKTPENLDELLELYTNFFSGKIDNDLVNFANVAYTANVGRATFSHRAVIIAKDMNEARNIIEKKSLQRQEVQYSGGKLCFLFTGQGSQYPGMAAGLYNSSPVFKMSFDKCTKILQQMYGISLKTILWEEPSHDELSRTLFSQTSIFCVEYSLLKLWESWGIHPDYVLGHSLGEFAAAVAVGALSLKSALHLVAERSRLIDALPRGNMIVVKADMKKVENILNEFKSKKPEAWLDYAALNACDQTVLAGDTETVTEFGKFCEEKNAKIIILAATHAFHSRHMDPMLEAYEKIASNIKPTNSQVTCQYISGMEGKLLQVEELAKPEYWRKHTREKVSFIEACKVAKSEGCTYFLEVGPHPVLSALAIGNIDIPGITCFPSLRRNQDDWATILESVGKIFLSDWNGSINWKGFDDYFQRRKLSLPFYPFSRKKIWADVHQIPASIHPLIGTLMENASAVTIFQNDITFKKVPYLPDHVIGTSIVFPGAGYLEMCLSSGYSHVQGFTQDFTMPRRPITLKNLTIESPLGMEDTRGTRVQAVVELLHDTSDSSGAVGYKTKIFHWNRSGENGAGNWVPHASAMFSPLVTDDLVLNMEKIDIKTIQETWKESTSSAEMYKKLPEVGLKFGTTFQTLERGWKLSGDDGDNNELLIQLKPPSNAENYIAHPVLVDGMLQTAMLWENIRSKECFTKKLHVPVGIKEFTWLRNSDSNLRFAYCAKNASGDFCITLVDGDGNPLMFVMGIEFFSTTSSIVESMIRQQSSTFPTMWEEIWRHKPGPRELEMKFDKIEDYIFTDEILQKAAEMNEFGKEEGILYWHLDGITVVHFLNALYELGWEPQCGEKINLPQFLSQLGIINSLTKFSGFFIHCLSEQGYLTPVAASKGGSYLISKPLPTKSNMVEALRHTVSETESTRADYKQIFEIGRQLPQILKGNISPLQVLFPENAGLSLADAVYEILHDAVTKSASLLVSNIFKRFMKHWETEHGSRGTVRILEVGAGTGMHTRMILKILDQCNIPYEYTFTDISAAFFIKAEEKFVDYNLSFKKFNIEEDPLKQGFVPQYYDLIIAAEVIHATKSIRKTLANLRLVLKDDGCLKILETTKKDKRITFIFGLLEGYWRFEDYDLRPDHATLSSEMWENVLNSSGYKLATAIPCYGGIHSSIFAVGANDHYPEGICTLPSCVAEKEDVWLIFGDESLLTIGIARRLSSLGRNVKTVLKANPQGRIRGKEDIIEILNKDISSQKYTLEGVIYLWGLVDLEERDQAKFTEPFLYLCKFLWDNQSGSPRIFVVTRGACLLDEGKYHNPSPSTLSAMTKVLRTETLLSTKIIDISSEKPVEEQVSSVFDELWIQDPEEMVAYRGDKRFGNRLTKLKVSNESLELPKGSNRFQLVLPQTRVFSDLTFGFLKCYNLDEHEIEVKVKATALNFRDVFSVLKPDPQFENVNAVGFDFSGVVTAVGPKVTKWKLGDEVFGCNSESQQALPSHIQIKESLVIAIPKELTFAEIVTLPVVFCTAYYCLVKVAKINSSHTVLLHTASGGVGLSAIQFCQHFGAKIIVTAGSERKRAYLRSLGIEHVFHSRNTNYANEILKVTNGRGVDIVLNSLTGPGFKEATLRACATNAQFVEMSKLTIWTIEEVCERRPDVKYTIVDLTALGYNAWADLIENMRDFVNNGIAKPIPYVRFDAVNIRSAMTYLQKAKHIGKIVCVFPELKLQDSKFVAITPLFNNKSTYMITGGIRGGIGLEVAKWMLSQGASNLVLVGRSKPSRQTEELIRSWEASGFQVFTFFADVGDYKQCVDLINRIKDLRLPPLRGVMHAAGTLSDGTLPNQTWEKIMYTFNAKVNGSWNLHDVTKNLPLEHFVLFSSLTALSGTPGQINHSAGNCFQDSLAYYRHSNGLPATTVNWGPWGQVGVATEVEIPGIRSLSTQQGITGLDWVLRTNRLQTGVINVDSFSVFAKVCPIIKNYIDDRSLLQEIKGPVYNVTSDEFWTEMDREDGKEEKTEVFKKYIKVVVRSVLKMETDEGIDDDAELQTLGVDSLMMLEMKNSLQNMFGGRMTVSANELKGCATTALLGNKLVDILLLNEGVNEVLPSMEELKELMEEDSRLDEHITVTAPLATDSPSQIKTVLVTGTTGMLAPYILQRVSNMPQISQIICIVRKRGKKTPKERLVSTLEANGLLEQVMMNKIKCIEGDIGQPNLGVSLAEYEQLALTVDGIFHCAAKVDHVQPYRICSPSEKSHIRRINVLGTKHILELATFKRTKWVLHASTFVVISSVNEEERSLSENWEPLPYLELPMNIGYVISKYVAEQLVKQAVERGVPCKSLRFPLICGDSQTGWHDVQTNHLMLRYLSYMRLGTMPSEPAPIVTLPVDVCADIAVKLFFDDSAPQEVFNVLPKTPLVEQEFPKLSKEFGHEIDVVEYSEFLEKLKNDGESSPLYSFMQAYQQEELIQMVATSPAIPSIRNWINHDQHYFHSKKLEKYCPEMDEKLLESPLAMVRRDLLYLKRTGIFKKFGL